MPKKCLKLAKLIIAFLLMYAILSCFFLLLTFPERRSSAHSEPLPLNQQTLPQRKGSTNPDQQDQRLFGRSNKFHRPLSDDDPIRFFLAERPTSRPGNSESSRKFEQFPNVTDLDHEFDFDVERDVLMFMQIPKTGSTEMELNLVLDAEVGERRDKCR